MPIEGTDQYGREYSHFAFLPDPLPRDVNLTAVTWTKVAEASEALGPPASGVRAPAESSTPHCASLGARGGGYLRIEGGNLRRGGRRSQARLSETRPRSAEVAEIRAYERAAYEGFAIVRERPLALSWLADLQGVLAADSRQPQRDPGRVREHQVVIGPQAGTVYDARYIPPPPDDRLAAGLAQWEEWVRGDLTLPPALKTAMAHYQFESLHPFGDGNGRIGRLIIVLQLLRMGAISEPAITISPWLRKRREEYQSHLLDVSMTGD